MNINGTDGTARHVRHISGYAVHAARHSKPRRNLGVSLQELYLTVRYNSAHEYYAFFASTLRGSSRQPFGDIFPKLKHLRLGPTFEKVALTRIERLRFVGMDALSA
jgi:hypothetical protein